MGSEGKEVVDLEQEAQQAVGLVIQRDQFPDKLFAPPKRDDLMEDDANPVYDKEIRSEIFSQGTLMLRLVIQVACCWRFRSWRSACTSGREIRQVVHLLCGDVQHARRAGVFGRQRDQRARARDARPAC